MRRLALLGLVGCVGGPATPCDPRFDADADGVDDCADCDDADADVHPGAVERCDGVDEDCDGRVDAGAVDASHRPDADGDGHGHRDADAVCPGEGTVADASDCDDVDAAVHPGAREAWNGRDDDCDGIVDHLRAEDEAVALLFGEPGWGIGRGPLAAGGDVTGDGADDVQVAITNDGSGAAVLFVVSGHDVEPGPQSVLARYALRIARATCADGCLLDRYFRRLVGPARDVVGDARADVIATMGDAGGNTGDVWVWDGALLPREATTASRVSLVLPSELVESLVAPRTVAAGDLDGQPGDELVVGLAQWQPPPALPLVHVRNGMVAAYGHGLCVGDTCPRSRLDPGHETATVWGAPYDEAGHAVAIAEITGEAPEDLVVALPGEGDGGTLRVFAGRDDLATLDTTPDTGPTGAWAVVRAAPGELPGYGGAAIATGPLTDDARADVAVATPTREVLVWRVAEGFAGGEVLSDALVRVAGPEGSAFGASLCVLPGRLVIGDPRADGLHGEPLAGALYVFEDATLAGATGVLGPDDADAVLHGSADGDVLGTTLACTGDLDGDGVFEVLAGAPGWDAPGTTAGHGAVLVVRVPR